MFTKHRRVGGIYKKELDFGKIVACVFWGFVILTILGALVG